MKPILTILVDVFKKLDLLEGVVDLFIRVLLERVKVLPDRSLNQERRLGDVSNIFSQEMEANVFDVNTVDLDGALTRVGESKEHL